LWWLGSGVFDLFENVFCGDWYGQNFKIWKFPSASRTCFLDLRLSSLSNCLAQSGFLFCFVLEIFLSVHSIPSLISFIFPSSSHIPIQASWLCIVIFHCAQFLLYLFLLIFRLLLIILLSSNQFQGNNFEQHVILFPKQVFLCLSLYSFEYNTDLH